MTTGRRSGWRILYLYSIIIKSLKTSNTQPSTSACSLNSLEKNVPASSLWHYNCNKCCYYDRQVDILCNNVTIYSPWDFILTRDIFLKYHTVVRSDEGLEKISLLTPTLCVFFFCLVYQGKTVSTLFQQISFTFQFYVLKLIIGIYQIKCKSFIIKIIQH